MGPEHPHTAISLNNLALLLKSKGDYEGAEPLYRRALAIREKVLGLEHPDTATSIDNLAGLLESKGDYESAEPLHRRALAIYEKVLGPEHPDTAISLKNLALLLRDKGDHGESAILFKRFISTYENKRVSDPSILNRMALCHNELAVYTEVPAKNWKEAEFHYRQAIELFTKLSKPLEAANVGLNLQTLFWHSGQEVGLDRVKELTRILDEAGDKRAEKGHKLLEELS